MVIFHSYVKLPEGSWGNHRRISIAMVDYQRVQQAQETWGTVQPDLVFRFVNVHSNKIPIIE